MTPSTTDGALAVTYRATGAPEPPVTRPEIDALIRYMSGSRGPGPTPILEIAREMEAPLPEGINPDTAIEHGLIREVVISSYPLDEYGHASAAEYLRALSTVATAAGDGRPVKVTWEIPNRSLGDERDADGLLPHHRERLLKAGHSISVNRGCGVRSILPSEPDEYPPGMMKFARPEFGPAIRYDYCSLDDPAEYAWSQLRPDLATKVKRNDGKPYGKYQQAPLGGAQQRLMAHPDMVRRLHEERFEEALLVEGTHQHLAGVRASMPREERVVFGLAGCFGWSIGGTGGDPIDDLRRVLAVPSLKRVIVALDADRNSNRMVWTAADRIRHAIRLAGKKALFLNLPETKENDGLDDVLARAGRPLTSNSKDA